MIQLLIRRRLRGALVVVTLLGSACGSDQSETSTSDTDSPSPTNTSNDPSGEKSLVDVQQVSIDSVAAIGGNTIEVTVSGGVEPCFIIDRVETRQTADEIGLTVFAGSEPDAVCIELVERHTIQVDLDAALGSRRIIDDSTGLPVAPADQPTPTTG